MVQLTIFCVWSPVQVFELSDKQNNRLRSSLNLIEPITQWLLIISCHVQTSNYNVSPSSAFFGEKQPLLGYNSIVCRDGRKWLLGVWNRDQNICYLWARPNQPPYHLNSVLWATAHWTPKYFPPNQAGEMYSKLLSREWPPGKAFCSCLFSFSFCSRGSAIRIS